MKTQYSLIFALPLLLMFIIILILNSNDRYEEKRSQTSIDTVTATDHVSREHEIEHADNVDFSSENIQSHQKMH